jgi:hypothetical protein
MRTKVVNFVAMGVLMVLAGTSQAVTIGFVSNPTGNSADWASYVSSVGATVSGAINFNTHPLGALQNNFYTAANGVTFSSTKPFSVVYGTGPNQPNTSTTPLSAGEGLHAASNYLLDDNSVGNLIMSFSTPVLGAGLFTIDHYNPYGNNPLAIQAYSGANGTGTLLGSFDSAAYNFQPDHKYFMGVASDTADIGSIVYIHGSVGMNDIVGIDDIQIATGRSSVPDSACTMLLLGTALSGLATLRRKLKS